MALAGLLSLLVPGLGHVYIGRFMRALIWLVGLVVIQAIVNGQGVSTEARWGMYAELSVCAAADAIALSVVDARGRRL